MRNNGIRIDIWQLRLSSMVDWLNKMEMKQGMAHGALIKRKQTLTKSGRSRWAAVFARSLSILLANQLSLAPLLVGVEQHFLTQNKQHRRSLNHAINLMRTAQQQTGISLYIDATQIYTYTKNRIVSRRERRTRFNSHFFCVQMGNGCLSVRVYLIEHYARNYRIITEMENRFYDYTLCWWWARERDRFSSR